jgi:hypothetical protein
MDQLMLNGGRVVGLLGALLMAFAVVVRRMGHYMIGGFQTVTLLMAGMAALRFGCFGLLWALTMRRDG